MSHSAAMQFNYKAIATVVVSVGLTIYFIYNFLPGNRSDSQLQTFSTWKTKSFQSIPEEIKRLSDKIEIKHRHISVNYGGQDYKIFVQEYVPNEPKTVKVLLLHGQAFSSETWLNQGTINLIAAMGYSVMAIDLPGYGQSKDSPFKEADERGKFLEKFIKQADLDRPVIVTPSMSGSFSIPYMMKNSPTTCEERLRGLVAVAPVRTNAYTNAQYHRCEVPAMIVYGTKDTGIGLNSVGDLRNMFNSEIFPIAGAGHACYLDNPKEFHYLLYNFLQSVERENM